MPQHQQALASLQGSTGGIKARRSLQEAMLRPTCKAMCKISQKSWALRPRYVVSGRAFPSAGSTAAASGGEDGLFCQRYRLPTPQSCFMEPHLQCGGAAAYGRAMLRIDGGGGPLWQLLLGPTADPNFKVGAAKACYVLTHLDDDLRTCSTARQSQGQIHMRRQLDEEAGLA